MDWKDDFSESFLPRVRNPFMDQKGPAWWTSRDMHWQKVFERSRGSRLAWNHSIKAFLSAKKHYLQRGAWFNHLAKWQKMQTALWWFQTTFHGSKNTGAFWVEGITKTCQGKKHTSDFATCTKLQVPATNLWSCKLLENHLRSGSKRFTRQVSKTQVAWRPS